MGWYNAILCSIIFNEIQRRIFIIFILETKLFHFRNVFYAEEAYGIDNILLLPNGLLRKR